MKSITFITANLFLLLIFSGCEKIETEIAPKNELSVIGYSETFMCQPVSMGNFIVALTKSGGANYLTAYDKIGNQKWQIPADEYSIPDVGFDFCTEVSLGKGLDKETILNSYLFYQSTSQAYPFQVIRAAGFDSTGINQWQITDTIHQPAEVINGPDTAKLEPLFRYVDMVHTSSGTHMIISAQGSNADQVTYLQVSEYGNTGSFVGDTYFRIPGAREIKEVFLTSNQNLFLYTDMGNAMQYYLMLNFDSTIVFETKAPALLYEHFFIYETSKGDIMISAATIDNTASYSGSIFAYNPQGNLLWNHNYTNSPTLIMTSVQEKSDGYLFSGFTSGTGILFDFDWRYTFSENEYHCLLLKTNFEGQESWKSVTQGIANTAGALSIGRDTTSLFIGKYDNAVKNLYLLKLDQEGKIINP